MSWKVDWNTTIARIYQLSAIRGGGKETLILMENIIYEIRKDVGLGRKLKKGDMLSFFINDIETLKKK